MRGAAYTTGMSDFDPTRHPRGHLSHPGRFTDKTRSDPEVTLSTYDPRGEYYTRLAATRDPQRTADDLARIVANEAEDDFFVAIAQHPNASADTLATAARHHSFAVRSAVAANPNTRAATLARMRRDANVQVNEVTERIQHEGRNPGTENLEWQRGRTEQLLTEIREALATRQEHPHHVITPRI